MNREMPYEKPCPDADDDLYRMNTPRPVRRRKRAGMGHPDELMLLTRAPRWMQQRMVMEN
jgi:hypothetical protein